MLQRFLDPRFRGGDAGFVCWNKFLAKFLQGFFFAALLVALSGAALTGCDESNEAGAAQYHCPMHPTYVSDHPGDCPICGMRLVPISKQAAPAKIEKKAAPEEAAKAAKYTCPMHPEVVSDKPGRCPKCGMDLVWAEDEKCSDPGACAPSEGEAKERKILFYRNPMDPTITSPTPAKDSMGMDYVPVYEEQAALRSGAPEGLTDVMVGEQGLKLAGVQTAAAVDGGLGYSVRTVGTVTADETRVRHVHTKVSGWVEKLYINFTGQMVRKGEPILSLYSPELLASQEEYLRVREAVARFDDSALPEVKRGGEQLVESARRRLELFDVPAGFIDKLESAGKVQRTVTLLAPSTGYITAKQIYEGQQVEPGMELFTVTDLSKIWVEADFYEYEARLVTLGMKAAFTMPYYPGEDLTGKVAYVYPILNTQSRTLRVRFDFDNKDLALKPGMFVNVDLPFEIKAGVVIPDSAVMDTGVRQVVYVDAGEGLFTPRQVKVGVRHGGKAQILSGVAAGERVVIKGNFLLDSESRIRAAIPEAAPAANPDSAGESR
ncbi:MAG: efflux RND transporter periplasmic adaptor subunit [Myxococcales bacterium]|nr:MAG: efflux RND transporter periplasmic adaptor subunit [Myxococcales bacterium]